MIKYLLIAVLLSTVPITVGATPSKNYDKIVAEWSSYVKKQKHSIEDARNNKEKSEKKDHSIFLKHWTSEIIKINKLYHKTLKAHPQEDGC